jgi:hypothetical protein
VLWLALPALSTPAFAADPAFRAWLDAAVAGRAAFGISRTTYDAVTR